MNHPRMTAARRSALVIGCGVSGLTCAVRLQQDAFDVRIVARDLPPDTTSNVAAAFWYPYRAWPQDRVLRWALESLQRFEELSADPDTAVSMVDLFEYLCAPDTNGPWWKGAVPGLKTLSPDQLPTGYVGGLVMRSAVIETARYLPWLMRLFESRGGHIERREVGSISELTGTVALIVNCTALGARALCGDVELFPIRGQLLLATNPGITHASLDDHSPGGPRYVIPRANDCVLGATAIDGDWSLAVDEHASRQILADCRRLDPLVGSAKVVEVKTGLRPGRSSVRLELERRDDGAIVIHNYGHGGAGVTLSWGCAEEVAALARSEIGTTRA